MKRIVIFLIFPFLILFFFAFRRKKETYDPPPPVIGCTVGYKTTCISRTLPGADPNSPQNTCPDGYFEMCLPEEQYRLVTCPEGKGIHPATNKCAPLSAIKVYTTLKEHAEKSA